MDIICQICVNGIENETHFPVFSIWEAKAWVKSSTADEENDFQHNQYLMKKGPNFMYKLMIFERNYKEKKLCVCH